MIKRIIVAVQKRLKNLFLSFKCIQPRARWLYRNRHLRMDANVSINDKRRRDFHKDRYAFAACYLQENCGEALHVLDAACGTGYGARILKSANPGRVLGIDISSEAVGYANRKYGDNNVEFRIGDVMALDGLHPGSFDAVVSFETIEHIDKPLAFLERIHQTLKPGGIFIISIPNKWGLTKDHVIDYDYDLLCDHAGRFFKIIEMYVQNSGCMDLWINRGAERRLEKLTDVNKDQAECFIAVCRK